MCVFSGRALLTIREFFPFIQFKSIKVEWDTSRVVLIRDESEILFFEPVKRASGRDPGREHVGRSGSSGNGTEVWEDEPPFDGGLRVIDSFSAASKPLLVQAWIEVFKGLLQQRDQFEALESEKHYADFLLDLLSHDIGNYNQIILLNLELAQAVSSVPWGAPEAGPSAGADDDDDESRDLAANLARARDALERSLRLVDNVKLLGKLRSTDVATLEAKNLLASIDESRLGVAEAGRDGVASSSSSRRSANRKKLETFIRGPESAGEKDPFVLADDFLGEIFVNLFSNALKYTDSEHVKVDIAIEEQEIGATPFWEISVSDYGRGIPDAVKDNVFDRYSKYARGTGLGLSIVNALVTRYEGRIWAGDRVLGDYSKGAKFGLLLKRA
jgi:signal transduction histidine kinase